MNTKTAWPTGTEVNTSIGLIQGATAPGASECQLQVDAVVNDFEERTGNIPFLNDGSSTARYYDPPDGRDGRLWLDVLCVSISEVRVAADVPNAGTVATFGAGADYTFIPENYAIRALPIRRINFAINPGPGIGSRPQSVKVTGKHGYSESIPTDLWMAVRNKAVANSIRAALALSGPVKELKQGDREVQYGIRGQTTVLEDYDAAYEAIVAKYTYIPSS